ncbi:MAG: SPFH domain-containing protein [Oscillospiraceae bacterium]|nr:SPFH domain-containing protein [Oscillospiraceae bacterium]
MALLSTIKGALGTLGDAAGSAISGTLQNQWKDYFEMDAMSSDLLICRGYKRQGERGVKKDGSRINKGDDHVIANGSMVAVAEGQCMLILDGGKLVELCAVPGEFIWEASTAPSMFTGNLGESIIAAAKQVAKSFTFGGEIPRSHRVYYINTKEIIRNPYGVADLDFRIVDEKIGLDIDAQFGCSGFYTYRIADPHLFYQFTGNVEHEYRKSGEFDRQIKSEVISAFGGAIAIVAEKGIRPNQMRSNVTELKDALNSILENKYGWYSRYGLELVSVTLESSGIDKQSEADLREAQKEFQKLNVITDPARAAALALRDQGEAMKALGANPGAGGGGAMMGVMGMGMMGNHMNAGANNALAALQQQQAMQQAMPMQGAAPGGTGWQCSCGTTATGNFCAHCGKAPPPPPPAAGGWTCAACNLTNTANFCPGCGGKKPEAGGNCTNCGTPVSGTFCANCGTKQG